MQGDTHTWEEDVVFLSLVIRPRDSIKHRMLLCVFSMSMRVRIVCIFHVQKAVHCNIYNVTIQLSIQEYLVNRYTDIYRHIQTMNMNPLEDLNDAIIPDTYKPKVLSCPPH